MAVTHDLRILIRDANFTTYTGGAIAQLLAYWMLRTASGWHAWALTGQSSWVGIVVAADMLPALIVGPWAGVLADRRDVRRVLLVCQCLSALTIAAAAALAAQGQLGILALVAVMALNGTVTGFSQPAGHAAITGVCARPQLGTAISLHSILFNVGRFVGPAIAGLLIAASGIGVTLAATAGLLGLGWATLLIVHIAPLERMARGGKLLADVWAAFRYVAFTPTTAAIFALYGFAALFLRPIGELLPEFAARTLNGDADTLAQLSSAMGLGAIAAGLANMLGGTERLVRLSYLGAVLAIAGGLGLSLATTAPGAIVFAMLFGGAIAAGGVSAQTIMQISAPAHMRGRIMSLFGMVFRAGPAIGAMVMGTLADRTEIGTVFAGGCLLMLMVVIALARDFRRAEASLRML